MADGRPNELPILRRVLPFLKPYRWQLAAGLTAMLVATPLSLFHPLVWMFVADEVAAGGQLHLLWPALGVMIAVHLLGTIFGAIHRNLLEKVGQRFVADLRQEVYRKLQRQSVSYHHGHRAGDLLSRAMNDIEAMQEAIIRGIDQVLAAFLRFAVVVTAIIAIHPVVGSATLAPILFVWLLVRVFNRRVKALYRRVRDRLGDVTAQLQENLVGQLVVKAFAQERQVMQRFKAANDEYVGEQFRAINARNIFCLRPSSLAF